jgi:tRNA A37 threonylcarbamoyladenosine dehydratase
VSGPYAGADLERRFGGVARLYGAQNLALFARARVAVVGLGGVGTWAAEALARSGVAHLTLIDLDHISESNTNRQIHALDDEFGKAKVLAMAQRIVAINPLAQVRAIEEFITADNVRAQLTDIDVIIDCTDQASAKAAMAAHARECRIALVVCGGAGGRKDPGRIRRDDLARTQGDALLANVRHRLRHDYGFADRGRAKRAPCFGIDAVYSDEPLSRPEPCQSGEIQPGSPLACGGYGSAVTVTATMGMAAAACALDRIQERLASQPLVQAAIPERG